MNKRIAARRLAHCFECGRETVQWLTSVDFGSPGSYRGVRVFENYTCSNCGQEQI